MPSRRPAETPHQRLLRRLDAAQYTAQSIALELSQTPTDPDPATRADVLISTENLADTVLRLLKLVRERSWDDTDPRSGRAPGVIRAED